MSGDAGQLDLFVEPGQRTPEYYVDETLWWIDRNWGAFWQLVRMCEEEARSARPERIRRGDVYKMARDRGISVTTCKCFRQDNNRWPSLSRYILMVRPATSKVLRPVERPNDVDLVDLAERWRGHKWSHPGRAGLFFPAERWQDAAGMVESGDVSAA